MERDPRITTALWIHGLQWQAQPPYGRWVLVQRLRVQESFREVRGRLGFWLAIRYWLKSRISDWFYRLTTKHYQKAVLASGDNGRSDWHSGRKVQNCRRWFWQGPPQD